MSFSQYVSDSSANFIVQCQSLQELDIIGSSVSVQAVVFILSKCRKLKKVNAVKLAQAIEELEHDDDDAGLLELVECMPETDRCGFVTATTSKHLKTLAKICPKIMTLSIFSENNYAPASMDHHPIDWNNNEEESAEVLGVLDPNCIEFNHLQVLNTWGGCLQRNFLRQFGTQLIELKLVHVEHLTLNGAIRDIFQHCPQLENLEIQNCSIEDDIRHSDSHAHAAAAANKLKQLIIVSKCSEAFMNRLLKMIPTLEILECGTSTGLTHQVLLQNVALHQCLTHLRIFKVAHSKMLNIQSVQLLLENCRSLKEISDLTSFPAISRLELTSLQNHLIQFNVDVKLC